MRVRTRLIVVQACCGMIAWFFVAVPDTLAQLKNGGFEEWTTNGPMAWIPSNKTAVKQDTQAFCEGKSSLVFELPTHTYVEALQEEKMPADPNKVYKWVFRFKNEGETSVGAYVVYYNDKNEARVNSVYGERKNNDTWTEKIAMIVPEPDVKSMSLKVFASGVGKVWFDQVTFAEMGPKESAKSKPRELLYNTGFEDYGPEDKFGGTPPVGAWRPNAPIKVTIVNDPKKAHSGAKCIDAEQESEGQGAIYQSDINVNYQKPHQLTLWAKGDGDLIIMVYQYHGGSLVLAPKIELTPEWKEYKAMYYPSSSLVTHMAPALHFTGEIWLDDVSLKEAE